MQLTVIVLTYKIDATVAGGGDHGVGILFFLVVLVVCAHIYSY